MKTASALSLVIGGRTGIGSAVVSLLQQSDHRVVFTSRNPMGACARRLRYHPKFLEKDLIELTVMLKSENYTIDFLFMTAAKVPSPDNADEARLEGKASWNLLSEYLYVNAYAPFYVINYLLRAETLGSDARLMVLSSQAGSTSLRGALPHMQPRGPVFYRASKAALNNLIKGLAFDQESSRHTMTLVEPGYVKTGIHTPGAEIEPSIAAAGIVRLSRLPRSSIHGKFLRLDGTEVPF